MSPRPPTLLLIDNRDSFTFNLAQALAVAGGGADIQVVRCDAISLSAALAIVADGLVISPGPGRPAEAGVSPALLAAAIAHRPRWPVLGVCLGHQMLAEAFGGRVVRAHQPIHGKIWRVQQTVAGRADRLWADLAPHPLTVDFALEATRYHSLIVDAATLPAQLAVSAVTPEGEVMALHHTDRPLFGVQFHPESIGCPLGPRLLANFVQLCRDNAAGNHEGTNERPTISSPL